MASVQSVKKLDYPEHLKEIIIAEGENPSLQRNMGADVATGEIIYFLDDDARLDKRSLDYLLHALQDYPNYDGFGGPSIEFDSEQSFLQRCVGIAFSSAFALGPSRARYSSIGLPRPASEDELIMCNFALKKAAWQKHAGFDQRLYPNEENEWMNRLQESGCKFLHHPLMIVRRRPRENMAQLSIQTFRYGMGRARQMRISQLGRNLIQFIPSLFLMYVLTLIGLGTNHFFENVRGSMRAGLVKLNTVIAMFPLATYVALIFLISLACSFSLPRKNFKAFALLTLIFPTIHLSYGLGMLYGLFTKLNNKKSKQIKIFKLDANPSADPYSQLLEISA